MNCLNNDRYSSKIYGDVSDVSKRHFNFGKEIELKLNRSEGINVCT